MMAKKALLLVPFLVLWGVPALHAQTVVARAPQAPSAPEAPEAFSFSFDGDNFLGIYTEEITRDNMNRYGLQREPRGVGIRRIVKGSPAERAGLKESDVILRFDGEAVTSVRKLNRLIDEAAPEHTARLTISRGGAEQEISVTLAKRRGLGAFDIQTGNLPNPTGELFRNPPHGSAPMVFGTGGRRLGISTSQLTRQLADYFGVAQGQGVLVTSVNQNSPADKAGLKAGDVITEVDGERIDGPGDISRAVNRKNEGEVTLTVIRDKKQRTIKVTPERIQSQPFNFSFELEPTIAARLVAPRIRVKPRVSRPLRLAPFTLTRPGTVL